MPRHLEPTPAYWRRLDRLPFRLGGAVIPVVFAIMFAIFYFGARDEMRGFELYFWISWGALIATACIVPAGLAVWGYFDDDPFKSRS